MALSTPVALIIFNRPDLTEIVFAAIRQAQPQQLLVIADGPRSPSEAERCRQARAIIDRVDWDCQVLTNFSEINLGCKHRVSSGLDWVFSQVEEAIIIEDDCLPDPSFFTFCERLLDFYRHDRSVIHIAGTNILPTADLETSFRFSRLVPIWGWATWRRAWQHNDLEMKSWPAYQKTRDLEYFGTQAQAVERVFVANYLQEIDSWDGQWAFSCLASGGLTILPKVNTIENLGFRADATHTKVDSNFLAAPVRSIEFPLIHPDTQQPDRKIDEKYLEFMNGHRSFKIKLKNKITRIFKRVLSLN